MNTASRCCAAVFMDPGLRRDDRRSAARQPPTPAEPRTSQPAPPSEEALIEGRRRPGVPQHDLPDPVNQVNPGAIRSPPPEAFPAEHIAVPDRWRLTEIARPGPRALVGSLQPEHCSRATARSACRPTRSRRAAAPPASRAARRRASSASRARLVLRRQRRLRHGDRAAHLPDPGRRPDHRSSPGSNDVFGKQSQPGPLPDLHRQRRADQGQHRLRAAAYRISADPRAQRQLCRRRRAPRAVRRAVAAAPTASITRSASRKPSSTIISATSRDRFDFDSVRVGIQPFNFDFRGFLFQDQQLGVRLFGNRDNNRFQYNLLAIWRLEKDTNSGLNNLFQSPRDDWILHANLFRQDFPFVGLTSQSPASPTTSTASAARSRSTTTASRSARPCSAICARAITTPSISAITPTGGSGGSTSPPRPMPCSARTGNNVFTGEQRAASRASSSPPSRATTSTGSGCAAPALFASGDGDPYDDVERGFDAIFENPIFAGADTSYWIRQTIPFAGGGRAVSRQRPQRHPQLAALVQGAGPVQLRQSGHDAARRRRRFRPHPALPPVGQRQPSLVPPDRDARGAARCRARSAATSAGTCQRRGDLAAAHDPEHRLPPVRRGAAARAPAFATCSTNENRDRRYYSVLFNAIVTY